jgi:hypothetical protein
MKTTLKQEYTTLHLSYIIQYVPHELLPDLKTSAQLLILFMVHLTTLSEEQSIASSDRKINE